jgi:hypothetical protein
MVLIWLTTDLCDSLLLFGRKPGPGGKFFWIQQLTPGLKCSSIWNLKIHRRDCV